MSICLSVFLRICSSLFIWASQRSFCLIPEKTRTKKQDRSLAKYHNFWQKHLVDGQPAWVTASASLLHAASILSRWRGAVQGCDAGLCVRTSCSCSLAQGVGVFLHTASCALSQACLSPNPLFKARFCFWAVRMDFLEVQTLLKMDVRLTPDSPG